MQNLIQTTYASRALFPISSNPYIVEPEVADILAKSRANNRIKRLVGVLCFGDGIFFQCLQGKADDVAQLLEVIKQDKRHTDLQMLHQTNIEEKTFAKWSMKYAGVGSEMRTILASYGYDTFNPYQFNDATILATIDFLKSSSAL